MRSSIMRISLFLICLSLLLGACRSRKALENTHPVQRYLPVELRDLYFGLPLEEFLQMRKNISRPDGDMDFRIVLIDEDRQGPAQVVYYFDADGDQPLYELIMNYDDATTRDSIAADLLGEPNYDETEWRYDSGEGYQIWAWKFQNKLVIVAILPDTEWADELE